MHHAPFYDVFPEIANVKTRCVYVLEDDPLPEPYCDQRRVFLHVPAHARKQFVAVMAFGWEAAAYRKWIPDEDPMALAELKGPVLNLGSPQCEISPAVLGVVREVLKDKAYVEKLKEAGKVQTAEQVRGAKKPGRNEPCPCGSSQE